MKALHLTNYFFPEYSGATTRLYNIASRLPFNVQILTSDRTTKGVVIKQKEEQFGNIKVNRIPLTPSTPMQGVPVLRYAYTLYRRPAILVRLAHREHFDIVHAHNSLTFGEAAEQLSRKFNKPFILELHGLSQESSTGVFRHIKALYIERIDRKLLKQCDHIITLTKRLKEWIVNSYNLPESKITVVPNGVDIGHFSPKNEHKAKVEELKKRLGANGKLVMYAGCMDRINGVGDLAKVIPHIIQKMPNALFVFVGGRPEERRLTVLPKQFPKNVKFLPMVPYEEMPAYYLMCDIFVIPRPSTISSEAITPLKLLEVMAMGKPVLASNVGGMTEVIRDGENGYLFEKGNLESLRKTLLEVLGADSTQIGNSARKTVVEKYTWDKSVKILEKVYEELT